MHRVMGSVQLLRQEHTMYCMYQVCLAWNPYYTLNPYVTTFLIIILGHQYFTDCVSYYQNTRDFFFWKWFLRCWQSFIVFFTLHITKDDVLHYYSLRIAAERTTAIFSDKKSRSFKMIIPRISVRLQCRLQPVCSFSRKVDMRDKAAETICIFGGTNTRTPSPVCFSAALPLRSLGYM